jgi:hypothetical protein
VAGAASSVAGAGTIHGDRARAERVLAEIQAINVDLNRASEA